MRTWIPSCLLIASLLLVDVGAAPAQSAPAPATTSPAEAAPAATASAPVELRAECSANTAAIPAGEIFELTFRHDQAYANAYLDVDIDVVFTGPDGRGTTVGGFLYGSSDKPKIVREEPRPGQKTTRFVYERPNLWKARFIPSAAGRWEYRWQLRSPAGRGSGSGRFDCVPSRRTDRHGFIRISQKNPMRWVYDDGRPYWPMGLQDGWGDPAGTGSPLTSSAMEGPFRLDRPFPLPPGAEFVRSPSSNPQNGEVHFRVYGQAGFNLFRFSQRNNAWALERNLTELLLQEGMMTDELLLCARRHGFANFYGIFGNSRVLEGPPWPDNPRHAELCARFTKYSVDRWGCMVDIWQFLNEKLAHDDWWPILIGQVRGSDPYRHPISTSWQRPDVPGMDVNAPHWYHRIDTIDDSDVVVAARAKFYKVPGKIVILGEHGNNLTVLKDPKREIPFEYQHFEFEEVPLLRQQGRLPPGAGGTWDPHSALRMRLRNWTALFHEISFVYWNTSYARDGHSMNIWLGPTERQYVKAMQSFADRLDDSVKMCPAMSLKPDEVRAYALASDKRAAVYIHHFADYTKAIEGPVASVDLPAGKACWYDPASGAVLKRFEVQAGRQVLHAPPFKIDIALLVSPEGPPDADGDGLANDVDPDDDNDGVPDDKDVWPLDGSEWADRDGDLIGDNFDADDDGDGVGDDANGNGKHDHEEMDFDGDGVPRAMALPFDAFPLDPKEWRDTDGDGIGDNADTDDDGDGDGYSDAEETAAGSDPLRPESVPQAKK